MSARDRANQRIQQTDAILPKEEFQPKSGGKGKYDVKRQIRLTTEEDEMLKARANIEGVSVSAYIRGAIRRRLGLIK